MWFSIVIDVVNPGQPFRNISVWPIEMESYLKEHKSGYESSSRCGGSLTSAYTVINTEPKPKKDTVDVSIQ